MEPSDTPTEHDMDEAVSVVLEGKKPKHEFLFSLGCSIKWKS